MLVARFLKPTGLRTMATAAKAAMPAVVRPSPSEIKNAALDARNLEIAVRHIHRDGLVVIEDIVPHDEIDKLNSKMVEDARALQALGDAGPFNYNLGNLQQDAPPVAEYFYPSIFTSKPHHIRTSSFTDTPRPNCYAGHHRSPGPQAQVDVLFCQLSDAPSSRRISSTSASPFRR